MYDDINPQELDNWITGNYGNDQYEEPEYCPDCQSKAIDYIEDSELYRCADCGWELEI